MTPRYASPEQVQGDTITVASDVYSLGAILYELLSGHPAHDLSDSSYFDLERVICKDMPERASHAVRRSIVKTDLQGDERAALTPEEIGRRRGTRIQQLRRVLPETSTPSSSWHSGRSRDVAIFRSNISRKICDVFSTSCRFGHRGTPDVTELDASFAVIVPG